MAYVPIVGTNPTVWGASMSHWISFEYYDKDYPYGEIRDLILFSLSHFSFLIKRFTGAIEKCFKIYYCDDYLVFINGVIQ